MSVRLTTLAVRDVTEARDHYRAIDAELEERLLDRLDAVMERLTMFPHGAPPVEGFPGVRRARIRQFPLGVFYRVDAEGVLVLRVLRTHRHSVDLD